MDRKKILIIGAGRSATSLIQYLLLACKSNPWFISILDKNMELAKQKLGNNLHGEVVNFDINAEADKIKKYDLVISMLPPQHHITVAQACVQNGKTLLTASYSSPQIQALHQVAIEKKSLILMECGLDPGIDHMSALQMIDEIKSKGGKIKSFKSYCGGLVAPESDTNKWGYKISWNPRNVVLAGQGGVSKYLENNKLKYLNYNRLFTKTDTISIPAIGSFEGYPNRDSLGFKDLYQLTDCETFVRGTLRKAGFCEAWHALVLIGLTDDSFYIENCKNYPQKEIIERFITEAELKNKFSKSVLEKINELDLFSDTLLPFERATPAMILQFIIENKWKMADNDQDMVVLYHEIGYEIGKDFFTKKAILCLKGETNGETAMSKTVGLPLGIAAKLILTNKINLTGVHLPITKEIYEPILAELAKNKIKLKEI
ncbi:MAG: saccharopine dehydrogenase [Bacteroidetes bacterium]|nr:MAG: saccharopine dehydrogenase [Bacteroidota bacterium]